MGIAPQKHPINPNNSNNPDNTSFPLECAYRDHEDNDCPESKNEQWKTGEGGPIGHGCLQCLGEGCGR